MLFSMSKLGNHDTGSVRGFNLIELMVTVAVVAVLGAIAYPNYTRYVTRSSRTDATMALLKLAAAQEKFYLQNNTYATTVAAVGIANTEHGWYTLAMDAADATTFTASAVPPSTSKQYGDVDCRKFTITAAGTRGALKSDGSTSNPACWR